GERDQRLVADLADGPGARAVHLDRQLAPGAGHGGNPRGRPESDDRAQLVSPSANVLNGQLAERPVGSTDEHGPLDDLVALWSRVAHLRASLIHPPPAAGPPPRPARRRSRRRRP